MFHADSVNWYCVTIAAYTKQCFGRTWAVAFDHTKICESTMLGYTIIISLHYPYEGCVSEQVRLTTGTYYDSKSNITNTHESYRCFEYEADIVRLARMATVISRNKCPQSQTPRIASFSKSIKGSPCSFYVWTCKWQWRPAPWMFADFPTEL